MGNPTNKRYVIVAPDGRYAKDVQYVSAITQGLFKHHYKLSWTNDLQEATTLPTGDILAGVLRDNEGTAALRARTLIELLDA